MINTYKILLGVSLGALVAMGGSPDNSNDMDYGGSYSEGPTDVVYSPSSYSYDSYSNYKSYSSYKSYDQNYSGGSYYQPSYEPEPALPPYPEAKITGAQSNFAFLGSILSAAVMLVSSCTMYNQKSKVTDTKRKIQFLQDSDIKNCPNANEPDPAQNGQLVYVKGHAEVKENLTDQLTGVSVNNCFKLVRQVEMHQWVEEKREERHGDRVHIKYSYRTKWQPNLVDSNRFRDPSHCNPKQMPFSGGDTKISEVIIGSYSIPTDQLDLDQFGSSTEVHKLAYQEVDIMNDVTRNVNARHNLDFWQQYGDWVKANTTVQYAPQKQSPQATQRVGDVRIKFVKQMVNPNSEKVIVLGEQAQIGNQYRFELKQFYNGIFQQGIYVQRASSAKRLDEKLQEDIQSWQGYYAFSSLVISVCIWFSTAVFLTSCEGYHSFGYEFWQMLSTKVTVIAVLGGATYFWCIQALVSGTSDQRTRLWTLILIGLYMFGATVIDKVDTSNQKWRSIDRQEFERYKQVENKFYLEFDKAPWTYQQYVIINPTAKQALQKTFFSQADLNRDGLLNEQEHFSFQQKIFDKLLKDSEAKKPYHFDENLWFELFVASQREGTRGSVSWDDLQRIEEWNQYIEADRNHPSIKYKEYYYQMIKEVRTLPYGIEKRFEDRQNNDRDKYDFILSMFTYADKNGDEVLSKEEFYEFCSESLDADIKARVGSSQKDKVRQLGKSLYDELCEKQFEVSQTVARQHPHVNMLDFYRTRIWDQQINN